jgi:hypothetical protein
VIRKAPDRPVSVHPGLYVAGLSYLPGWTLLNQQKRKKRLIMLEYANCLNFSQALGKFGPAVKNCFFD